MFQEHARGHVDTDVTCITDVPKLVFVFAREFRLQSANAHYHSAACVSVLWHVPWKDRCYTDFINVVLG
jgi:hypothetical protein